MANLCHKCKREINLEEDNEIEFVDVLNLKANPVFFHEECFNRYEHYYGLDKPID